MTVTSLTKALKYAVKKGMLPYSIMDKVDRPKPKRFVGKFLKQSEVVELFEAVKGHKLELGVILGAFYGLRRAEIVDLRWDGVKIEPKIFLRKSKVSAITHSPCLNLFLR